LVLLFDDEAFYDLFVHVMQQIDCHAKAMIPLAMMATTIRFDDEDGPRLRLAMKMDLGPSASCIWNKK
jgi:hypothetical protein